MKQLDLNTISVIEKEYLRDDIPWAIGYSGGKDSTAMLKLVYNSLLNIKLPKRKKEINIIYCDTGVEIPIVNRYVKKVYKELNLEIAKNNLPIKTRSVEPKLEDRFFAKVIGKGYPTPTNKFRWCTDRLRILPIQSVMYTNKYIVLVGVRSGESEERDKILIKNGTREKYYLRQSNHPRIKIFAPILDYDINNVWDTIRSKSSPYAINSDELEIIYEHASNKLHDARTVSKGILKEGRLGCWTCTVVRKDKAMKNLIDNGHRDLIPLYEFRNWIYELRDNEQYRCKHRRNGQSGLGPFTIEARKMILDKLLDAQRISNYPLINDQEIEYIKNIWEEDQNDKRYREN